METTTQNTVKSLFETWAEAQKKAMDSWTENTEKFQKEVLNGNKGTEATSDYFKKWYDSQMAFFYKNNEGKSETTPMDMFNNWMSSQMEASKKMLDMNQFSNPTAWMGQMPGMNPDMKNNMDQAANMYQSWIGSMSNTYHDMMKNFSNTGNKEYFSSMFNNTDSYMKMFQLWMPVLKSLQDKTFSPDQFKHMFNASLYKDMMDKMFNFSPDFTQNMFGSAGNDFREKMMQSMDQGKNWFGQMKNQMNAQMPPFMQDPFNSYLSAYQNMQSQLQNASSPFAKMMNAGPVKDQMEKSAELSNRFNLFHVRNAQVQYMVYTTGIKAMETLSEGLYSKMKSGEEVKSFTQLYSELLNTMDKAYVELFQTEEYSAIQSELSATGLRLKKDIDLQVESMFRNVPLVPRSEMDELYKTIHDLKARIRQLEKQPEVGTAEATAKEEPKATAKKSKNS